MYRYYGSELYHYGIAGRSGRYPWGSGGRPYQRLEKPKNKVNIIKRIKNRKTEKNRIEKEKEKKKIIEEKQKLEKDKERILSSGTPSEIINYKEKIGLTNQELQEALNRVKITEELKKFAAKEVKTGWDVMNDTANKLKNVNILTVAGIEAYKNFNTIIKFIDEASKEPKNSNK